jgi:hypothetical protein
MYGISVIIKLTNNYLRYYPVRITLAGKEKALSLVVVSGWVMLDP